MGSRDSQTRIVVEKNRILSDFERQTTGEHKALVVDLLDKQERAARAKWLYGALGGVASALILGAVLWLGGAAADKAKALITHDVAADVTVLKKDVRTLKDTIEDHGDVLDALFSVDVDGADPSTAKVKMLKKRSDRKAAKPKDNNP